VSGILSFFVTDAYAQGSAATPANNLFLPIMMVFFVGFLYFTVWGPQNKRSKEHQLLIRSLAVGDEVLTNSGIIGKVTKMFDQYVQVEVSANTLMTIQRSAISHALPKGTLQSL
jgi:preprotein translocase subunit YajC